MAGTINFAMTQQFDMDGEPLGGGLLYFFAAGSTTPQDAFQDSALTILHPNPIELDASGRVPMFYLASTLAEGNESGQIKIRLTDDSGVTIVAADNLLIIGPAGGGGGGGTVDATTVLAAGDIKGRFGTGPLDGFVRCNGSTIGNAVSGSTERANADCQTLFEYLWSTAVLGVFSGTTPSRGSTANADWLANKRIALPDLRGRTIAGMDDMGAASANVLNSSFFNNATILGAAGGFQSQTLTAAQLAAHTHTGTTGNQSVNHTHVQQGTFTSGFVSADHSHSGTTATENQNHDHAWGQTTTTGLANSSLDHTHNFTASVSNTLGAGAGSVGAVVSTSTTAGANSSLDHTHNFTVGGTTGLENQTHTHGFTTGLQSANHTHQVTISGATGTESTFHAHAFTTNAGDGVSSTPHTIVQPTMVLTFYIKL